MRVENVINGIIKYVKGNLYPTMTEWQKILAADIISRSLKRMSNIEKTISENTFVQALGYVDTNGNVDIDNTIETIKQYIVDNGGKFKLKLPLMPEYTFSPDDIDVIYNYILKE